MIKSILILLGIGLYNPIHAQESSSISKHRPLSKFDDMKTVFKLKDEQLTNKNGFMRYVVLTGYREGVEPIHGPFNSNFKAQVDRNNTGTHRIKMYNLSIYDMLTGGMFSPSQVILELKDSSKYKYDPKYGDKKEWLRKNGYCYEILMPTGVIKTMNIVRDDQCRIFKLRCNTEKRKVGIKEKDYMVIREIN